MSTAICRVFAVALFAVLLVPLAASAQDIKVTLLGTGSPPVVAGIR